MFEGLMLLFGIAGAATAILGKWDSQGSINSLWREVSCLTKRVNALEEGPTPSINVNWSESDADAYDKLVKDMAAVRPKPLHFLPGAEATEQLAPTHGLIEGGKDFGRKDVDVSLGYVDPATGGHTESYSYRGERDCA